MGKRGIILPISDVESENLKERSVLLSEASKHVSNEVEMKTRDSGASVLRDFNS